MERYLAHHVIHQGRHYGLSILSIRCIDGLYCVDITPFERETPGTAFHNGTIAVCSRKCSRAYAALNPYLTNTEPPVLVFF